MSLKTYNGVDIELVEGKNFFEAKFTRKIPKKFIAVALIVIVLSMLVKPLLLIPEIVIYWMILDRYPSEETLILIEYVGIQLTISKVFGRTKNFAVKVTSIKHVFINEVLSGCDVRNVLQILYHEEGNLKIKVPFKGWFTPLSTHLTIINGLSKFLRHFEEESPEKKTVPLPEEGNICALNSRRRYNLRSRSKTTI